MLGKLLKYEFKSTSRLLGIIYLAILVMSVVIGISCRSMLQEVFSNVDVYTSDPSAGRIVSTIAMVSIYVILVIALVIITYYFIIERFYKSMLKGEGYLMHTLPVSTWELVACKTISGFVWSILGSVVIFLSVFLILASGGVWNTVISEVMNDLASFSDYYLNLHTGLWIVSSIVNVIRLILTFYVAMAIGGAAKKHKMLYSVLAFIVILIIMRVIAAIGNFGMLSQIMSAEYIDSDFELSVNAYMVKNMIFNIIYAVIFFIGTTFFLKKRLNLE